MCIRDRDNSGNAIYNSMNSTDEHSNFFGYNFQHRAYEMYYVGNAYCMEYGAVFLEVSKTDPKKMTLFFARDSDSYNPDKCPNFTTFVPLLPKDKMILIKQ